MQRNDLEVAEKKFKTSLEMSLQSGYRRGIANSYNYLGLIEEDKGDFSKSINLHQKSLMIFEEIEDKRGESDALVNLGRMYHRLEDFEKRDNCIRKATKIKRKHGFVIDQSIIDAGY